MITLDGVIFSLPNRTGGVSVYFRKLAQQLASRGEQLAVLVHDATLTAERVGCDARQLLFRPPRPLERFRSVRGLPRGVLHSSYYRSTSQAGVRNVVTVYDFTYEKFTSGVRARIHTLQKRRAILRADAVICISENTRHDLLELVPGCPPEKVFVTHLAASEEFRPLAGCEDATRPPFVLFIGGRGGYKNFRAAVQAVGRTRDYALVCVGSEPFNADERALLESTLPGRYSNAGPVGIAALNELYNRAVCLVYPSLYEGFGIPPLEAMQAGCPFVALNRSSIPEVAGRAGILLDDPAAEAIAAAIEACAVPQRRAQLRQLGYEQARRFSWVDTYEKTSDIYRKLLP